MVKAEDSQCFQQDSAWRSPNLNLSSTLLPPSQLNSLPSCMKPSTYSANVAFPGLSVGLNMGQVNGDHGLSQCLPPLLESSHSPLNPYFRESQFAFLHGLETTPNALTGSSQKNFLIFDQSGNQTRLFFSAFGSSYQNPVVSPIKPICVCHLHDEKRAAIIQQIPPTKPIIQETSDDNHISGNRSEMHEDTEEINALLYSDEDAADDDGQDSEDDELRSTGHSPLAIKPSHELVGEIIEEVASSDGSTKRRRLLDGEYKISSLVGTASSVDRPCQYNEDAELNCASGRSQVKDMGSTLGNKRLRNDKIDETLRVLESIVPGSKSKDPLLIIDEAINYLKSLRLKAKALGVGYPKFTTSLP